jgi:Bacterial regulatory proteins, luxR family/HD domain
VLDGLTTGELVAVLALGQDNAFGQPLETQTRTTLLAIWLAEAAGLPAHERDTAYWAAQLRYLGCTAHAHEVAAWFGDDIQTRARTTAYDASSPAEVLRDTIAHGRPERRGLARLGAVAAIVAGGRKFAEMNFRSGCEAADILAARLGMAQAVRDALACTFERWNGNGQPNRIKGERIPLPMRRAAALDALNPVAACHHEKADGSGYFKGLTSHQLSPAARILGAADRYQAMTQRRAYRPPMSPDAAAAELRRMVTAGEVDGDAAECVLTAADHAARSRPEARPAGLTAREAEVLALAASGLTTAQIAQRLVISPRRPTATSSTSTPRSAVPPAAPQSCSR